MCVCVCVCVCVCEIFPVDYFLLRLLLKIVNDSLVGWVLWHINFCKLFNAKSIFMQIVLFKTIQFSISTQFNCQKHSYFKLFSLFKQQFYIK